VQGQSCWEDEIFTQLQSCMVAACDADCDVPQAPTPGEGGGAPMTAGVGGSTTVGSGGGGASTSGDDVAGDTGESSSCAVSRAPSSTSLPAWLLAALVVVSARRSRRNANA